MNKHKISSRFCGKDVEHELIILMFAKVKKKTENRFKDCLIKINKCMNKFSTKKIQEMVKSEPKYAE